MKLFVIALLCLASVCLAQTGEDQATSLAECMKKLNFDAKKEREGSYKTENEQKKLAECIYKRQGFVTKDCKFNLAAFETQSPGFSKKYKSKHEDCHQKHKKLKCADKIVEMEKCIRPPPTPAP